MSTGSLLLGAALIVLVGLFLARPFLLSGARSGRQHSSRQQLTTQKEAILAQIQVLEFDYETGTLPELDYKRQRRHLVDEAAAILQKLDELPAIPSGGRTDKEIEAAVAQMRQRPPHRATPAPVKAAPKPPASKPAVSTNPQTTNGRVKFCAQCGQPVEESDNFCAYCGHKVIQPQPT